MDECRLTLPQGVRCAVALSYDLEMCAGYAPDGVNHGRLMPALQEYTLRLCEVAERYGVALHFFYVCNGLEGVDARSPLVTFLRELVERGHVIDSHTYSHQGLAVVDAETLNQELAHANRLLWERLGVRSTVLRGPGGYPDGRRTLSPANRRVILDNGFRWVSGEYDPATYGLPREEWVSAPARNLPYRHADGLVEIPIQGWTDRMWFDMRPEADAALREEWRAAHGHRPVPEGWRAPWTVPHAMEDWIALNRDCLETAYQHGLMWVPCWHPYTQYLHDPDARILTALLEHAASKPERAWVCTLRDAAAMLEA
jgi:peptidoglycan/xylan/chitin deacetylase (PgdA/CDA1 family)